MSHKNLSGLILLGEFDDGFRDVSTADHSRFNLQAPSESKVPFDLLTLLGGQFGQFSSSVHEKGDAVRWR